MERKPHGDEVLQDEGTGVVGKPLEGSCRHVEQEVEAQHGGRDTDVRPPERHGGPYAGRHAGHGAVVSARRYDAHGICARVQRLHQEMEGK